MDQQIVNQLLEYLKGAGEFTKEQAPLYAEELLKFGLVMNTVSLIIILGGLTALFFLSKKYDKEQNYAGACIVVSLLILPFAYSCIVDIVKIQMAPRVYVLSKVSSQLLGGSQ